MSEGFPAFIYVCPYTTRRVESAQSLKDLAALLTIYLSERDGALDWITGSRSGSKSITALAGIPTFGHGADFKATPTLGEWLAKRGILVE